VEFASDRARAQVERILSYLASPGLAFIVDADGLVLAAVGAVRQCDARSLVKVFGERRGALIGDGCEFFAELGDSHVVLSRTLRGERMLFLVTPYTITPYTVASSAVPRLDRAQKLLDRMLATSSDRGSPTPAHAAVWYVAIDRPRGLS
jgi:hypothetical protein